MKEDCNPIPLFYTAFVQEVAELVSPAIHLLVGEGLILEIERLFLRL
jgi:hypothetical protein